MVRAHSEQVEREPRYNISMMNINIKPSLREVKVVLNSLEQDPDIFCHYNDQRVMEVVLSSIVGTLFNLNQYNH